MVELSGGLLTCLMPFVYPTDMLTCLVQRMLPVTHCNAFVI